MICRFPHGKVTCCFVNTCRVCMRSRCISDAKYEQQPAQWTFAVGVSINFTAPFWSLKWTTHLVSRWAVQTLCRPSKKNTRKQFCQYGELIRGPDPFCFDIWYLCLHAETRHGVDDSVQCELESESWFYKKKSIYILGILDRYIFLPCKLSIIAVLILHRDRKIDALQTHLPITNQ